MTGSLQDVEVALLMTGAELDPMEVTTRLRLKPTFSAFPDHAREFRSGFGLWMLLDAPAPNSSTLESRLSRLADALDAVGDVIDELRMTRKCALEILVRGRAEGTQDLFLSPECLKSAAELDVSVSFTVRRCPSDVDVFFDELLSGQPEAMKREDARAFDYLERPWSAVEVTLRLSHPELVPADVTRKMRLAPSRSTEPGGSAHSPDGFWVAVFSGRPTRSDNPIPAALARLYERGDTIARLVEAGVSAELTIVSAVVDGATLTFAPEELAVLADIRVPLRLCAIAK